ncbi:MAG: hypothetical protein KJ600_02365, partial [Nanoarchaeota archaeon]|nr:hypothetical protein [Nanoarchaeota archaeon]
SKQKHLKPLNSHHTHLFGGNKIVNFKNQNHIHFFSDKFGVLPTVKCQVEKIFNEASRKAIIISEG